MTTRFGIALWNEAATWHQVEDGARRAEALGFQTFMAEIPAPYDPETMERWTGEVRPLVDRG